MTHGAQLAENVLDGYRQEMKWKRLENKVMALEDENMKLQAEIILQADSCRDQNKKLRQEAEIFKRKYIELKEVVIKKEMQEEEELEIRKREAKQQLMRLDKTQNGLEMRDHLSEIERD